MTDISVIIVNWNTRDLLLGCIEAVFATVRSLSFEVWVVDNGSSDGSVDAVRSRFPSVKVIANSDNRGFSMANNQALRLMNGRYAALLNSDTKLTAGALETIVTLMDADQSIGICGGQLLNADGSYQNSIANIPTLATELLNKSLLRRLFPRRFPGKERQIAMPIEVESVIGACMVARRKAIETVGLLDEDYFFFLEETDWCNRMRKAGWKIVHHPGAKIYHFQGQSVGTVHVRARTEYWRSRYLFFRKNHGPATRGLLTAGLILKIIGTILLASIGSILGSARSTGRLKLYLHLFAWHAKGLPEGYGLR